MKRRTKIECSQSNARGVHLLPFIFRQPCADPRSTSQVGDTVSQRGRSDKSHRPESQLKSDSPTATLVAVLAIRGSLVPARGSCSGRLNSGSPHRSCRSQQTSPCWRSTRFALSRWTPCRRPTQGIRGLRWPSRRWPTRFGRTCCGSIPPIRFGRTGIGSCSRSGMPQCCGIPDVRGSGCRAAGSS